MRQLIKTLLFVALAVSCTREIVPEPAIDAPARRYNIAFAESTKTELNGTGNTRNVTWKIGDEIQYYTEEKTEAKSTSVSVSGDQVYISIPEGRSDEFINAIYGATSLNGNLSSSNRMYVSSPIKDSQNYISFKDAHICAAFSDDIYNTNLTFHNVAGILKFKSDPSIYRVIITGNDNEIITAGNNGDLTISYSDSSIKSAPDSGSNTKVIINTNGSESDFYVAVLPVNFSKGITIYCYDSNNELLTVRQNTKEINTVSATGHPRIINLGNAQEWIADERLAAIDLGLSVKWAQRNIGANKPEDYGDYYSWGEIETKNEYTWASYKYEQGTNKNGPFSKYVTNSKYGNTDHKTILDPEDDVAHISWGKGWRMPSKEETEELKNNCSWTWTKRNGISGYKITSRNTGFSIFLPAAGMMSGSSLQGNGEQGNYWSASLNTEADCFSWSPYFCYNERKNDKCYRHLGLTIRPVYGEVIPVTEIRLSKAKIDFIELGDKKQISATVFPENATYKNITWVSSDDSIVTVDHSGIIISNGFGEATITAYSADGLVEANCQIIVLDISELVEYVDLGLSVKWATFNVGATKPEEYGDYYAWGETVPKTNYSLSTYKWCSGSSYTLTKYNTKDNKKVLDPEDDVAHEKWGGSWRMPTDAEWTELWTKCTWTWTSQNGVNGRMVTGPNGKSIFLPAAGERGGVGLNDAGSCGYYWSSHYKSYETYEAWGVYFNSGNVGRNYNIRFYGRSVRPVYGEIVPVSSISIPETATLPVGKSETLAATVLPADATYKKVTWSSSDESIATVDANGLVKAVAVGTAIITAYGSSGVSASCTVSVSAPDLSLPASVKAVDLGLPSGLKWATMNVGASAPEEYGEYFAWGEIEPVSITYKWWGRSKGSYYTIIK